jgi:Spy/CpxP family protein refolding chaperone
MLNDARPTWSNPRILSLLALVFLAGVFTGGAAMKYGLHQTMHRESGFGKANKEELLSRCKRELNLTDDQSRQVSDIIDNTASYYQTLQDQLSDVKADSLSKIRALLNDEQKQKFERLVNELQRGK